MRTTRAILFLFFFARFRFEIEKYARLTKEMKEYQVDGVACTNR